MATLIAFIILFLTWILLSIRKGWYHRNESNVILSIAAGLVLFLTCGLIDVRDEKTVLIDSPEFVIIKGEKYLVTNELNKDKKPSLQLAASHDTKAFLTTKKSLFGWNTVSYYYTQP